MSEAVDSQDIPEEWLRKLAERYLSEEEKREIEAMGWDKLFETLKQRLEEQKKAATRAARNGSAPPAPPPYGAYGYNPEGIRIGQDGNRNFRAVKVWDKREFRDLDDQPRTRHPQHARRAAPATPFRPHGRGGRARPSTGRSAARLKKAIST